MKSVIFVTVGVLLMFALSAAIGLITWHLRVRRLRRIAASRDPSHAFAMFQSTLAGLPEPFVRDNYVLVQSLVEVKDFPIEPDDDIWKLYDLDQGNVDNELETIFENYPRAMELLNESSGPINTVHDLVAFIYNIAQQGGVPLADVLRSSKRRMG